MVFISYSMFMAGLNLMEYGKIPEDIKSVILLFAGNGLLVLIQLSSDFHF